MASPFKQKGKKPAKKTAKQVKSESKAAHFGAKGYYATSGGSASVSAVAGPVDAKVEAKGTSAKPHGAAGVRGRTSFGAASQALALAKGEAAEEYTIASVLREPNRG